ncbi:SMI1/KNR4 family protein [Singulisphaera sp. Ch08]|uniref:SMI1/KNR4 family protein n=1 Tax=Singulisphaera sp. Ch08 TaxID=3120278 RepID=A0AAU7CKQ3_9BACT
MPGTLDRSTILQRLADLDRRDQRRKVFGAASHQYKLNPPLPVSVIEAFEERHGVSLPEDYRLFMTEIGNGGAGPYYGILPFGKDDDDRDWEGGGLVGDPSKPFPHTTAWNLPESFWGGEPDPPPGTTLEEEDRLMEAWDRELEAHYWNPAIMGGAIPICHKGCALRQWLVIHGEQRGFVWDDLRADNAGIAPVLDESGEPVTFADWYMSWLDSSLRKASETPWSTVNPLWRRIRRRFGRN